MDIIAQLQFGLALVKLFTIVMCATFTLAIGGGIVSVVIIAVAGGASHGNR